VDQAPANCRQAVIIAVLFVMHESDASSDKPPTLARSVRVGHNSSETSISVTDLSSFVDVAVTD